MPELPEVETIRSGIDPWIRDRTIGRVEVTHPRAIRWHTAGAADFAGALRGAQIAGARRRGKYMWLPLRNGDAIMCHLGMSGQLLIQPPEAPAEKHLRIRVDFDDDGQQLRFVDQRTFGYMRLSPQGASLPAEIAHVGVDVYDPAFDLAAVTAGIQRRRSEIKRALLDQTLVSGVGNIYADEALWSAGIHARHPTWLLTAAQISQLMDEVKAVFDQALRAGGTSFDALYVNVNGESGYFDRSLAVYGRHGEPCRRCRTLIRREKSAGRSSFFCPRCQVVPD